MERLLCPTQQRISLAVALYLLFYVAGVRVAKTEGVDLHGVIDDEVDRHERVDLAGVLAGAFHRRTHRREIHHRRHSGEVLHQDASGKEGQLRVLWRRRRPGGQCTHTFVVGNSRLAQAQQAFEEDLDRHRQGRRIGMAVLGEGVDRIDLEIRAVEPGRRGDHDRIVLASITVDPSGGSSIEPGSPGTSRRCACSLKLSATITLSSSIHRS